ncbi:MAG: aldo/keto reductase [Candidatus Latescibacterota bacterium]|nr:MAG: aldo/keto reductase [Candidatus Latescibacterota bacterium]
MMKSKSPITRRAFLQTGTTALAGATLLSSGSCSQQSKETPPQRSEFVQRTLGRTGLRLPVVSMGACYGIDLVRSALDNGIVYIHTSSDYSERNHERLLGRVFQDRPRDSFVIGTSPDLPYTFRGSGPSEDLGRDVEPGLILESIEGSLERLKLDYVDIYYLGSMGRKETLLHEPYIDAYAKLKRDGKTRFVGITTHENEPEVIRAAANSGFWDVVLTSYNFRQSHREEMDAAIQYAADRGLGFVGMKTQAGVYWDRKRTRKINMTAALKWALQNENIHTVVPAFSSFEEMEEDIEVMKDLTMTPEETRDLALGDELGYSGHYCQQCGGCLSQCPERVDIPTLMRCHMYAYGHRQPRKARDTLGSWTSADIPCSNCARCPVSCALGFDVQSRALEIARVLDVPDDFIV